MADPVECPLCNARSESLVWQQGPCRVILVPDADYPGYCHVIWEKHVAEMTDLAPSERALLLEVVCATEAALRALMQPDKVNLASLGNMVPHLHWHVIPRFGDDAHYPQTIWGIPQRSTPPRSAPDPDMLARHITATMRGTPDGSANSGSQ